MLVILTLARLNFSSSLLTSHFQLQLLPLPGNAQAKIEDMSRLLLNHVSQMPSKMPMAVIQVTESNAPPLAGVTQRIAVRGGRPCGDALFY